MAQPPPSAQVHGRGIIVPDELKKKYPQLIELVLKSESMNDEERQYWINILPIMTPDQVENLRGILKNEREQLAAIDKRYSKQVKDIGDKKLVEQVQKNRQERRTQLKTKEAESSESDDETAESLLEQIDKL